MLSKLRNRLAAMSNKERVLVAIAGTALVIATGGVGGVIFVELAAGEAVVLAAMTSVSLLTASNAADELGKVRPPSKTKTSIGFDGKGVTK